MMPLILMKLGPEMKILILVKYQDGDNDDTLQAKYQAKVDELAKMRRSASPDAAKAELIFRKNQNIKK